MDHPHIELPRTIEAWLDGIGKLPVKWVIGTRCGYQNTINTEGGCCPVVAFIAEHYPPARKHFLAYNTAACEATGKGIDQLDFGIRRAMSLIAAVADMPWIDDDLRKALETVTVNKSQPSLIERVF